MENPSITKVVAPYGALQNAGDEAIWCAAALLPLFFTTVSALYF